MGFVVESKRIHLAVFAICWLFLLGWQTPDTPPIQTCSGPTGNSEPLLVRMRVNGRDQRLAGIGEGPAMILAARELKDIALDQQIILFLREQSFGALSLLYAIKVELSQLAVELEITQREETDSAV
jgi:hypothetical protein